MIDVAKISALLTELVHIEDRIADREPIKVLPRLDAPDLPKLQARREVLFAQLAAKRNYKTPKGHDLNASGLPSGYDLASVGIISEMKSVPKGKDRALPSSSIIVQVGFPSGEHLWFDPHDLDTFVAAADTKVSTADTKVSSGQKAAGHP